MVEDVRSTAATPTCAVSQTLGFPRFGYLGILPAKQAKSQDFFIVIEKQQPRSYGGEICHICAYLNDMARYICRRPQRDAGTRKKR
jgi:hypothetical protein